MTALVLASAPPRKQIGSRCHIREVIDRSLFYPVFQPFVDLGSGATVGYEALTRFDDGRRPDVYFDAAHAAGLGSELEAACVQAALRAFTIRHPAAFLSVNFSPTALLDGSAAQALADTRHQIVIEITEHAPIEDYAAVRRAIDEIATCGVAVDDVGAGYTSLRHILELKPEYLKLDISLVRGVDSDLPRQAMVAAMCCYALRTRTVVIAEGVETSEEATTLRSLGVDLDDGGILGQGYLFGRPAAFS